ncbi:MAG TPA: TonB-dependent receptor [Candidatus Acidoferrum sp.]|nr:TonB-dependent receptor [Candidatus Acidoferrum sp.]
MQFLMRNLSSSRFIVSLAFLLALLFSPSLHAQSTYTAQLTGVITDSSGGVIASAKVTLTDEATNVPASATTNDKGIYVLTGLRPGRYTLRAEATGFAPSERRGITLAVSQQTTLDLTLSPVGVAESVTVTDQVPLLDTGSASLGTDVTNEYVRDIPLVNRSFFSLVFLAGGVTETAGQGTQDSYPTGTNFVSNGQRNATAEIRVDGALTSAPEQGEGATTNVYWQPSVEIVQEFKVENNSFSSEFGNNGGTVVNIVLKEGGNKFHGSGWWFGQRSALDANEFFRNANGIPNPDHVRDQYGFSFGGPIKKGKTFFFVDFEKTRQNDPVNIDAFVPTALERAGDFRNTQVICTDSSLGCTLNQPVQQHVFNPLNVDTSGNRSDFAVPNVIDSNLIDPIGQKIINLYPQPTVANAAPGTANFHKAVLSSFPGRQYDIKLDHHFSEKHRISGRYSNLHNTNATPTVFGDGDFNDGLSGSTDVHNVPLEDNWSPTATTVWTNRIALDRAVSPVHENYPSLTSVGLPPILAQANGLTRFPVIQMDNNATSLFNQCCTDTNFAHTLYSYSSSMSWVKGRQIWKFGGEQRLFYNNFYQPNPPTGFFHFTQGVTEQVVGGGNSIQGNSFASLLLGYGDIDPNNAPSSLAIFKAVANKSKETAFYFQDDWKLNSKLTVNLGLRYEWSTPYNERNNLIQFSNFTADSGIAVPIVIPGLINRIGNLAGATIFPSSGHRSIPVDRNNWAPRLGFAYALDSKTVVRGGAGVYYGLNVATNFQFTGTAFGKTSPIRFTKDNFQTRTATLAVPFPSGFPPPQVKKYGPLAEWGFSNNNSLDTGEARNAEIYQWNLGIQRLFPGQIVIGVDYSANRSTHLPYSSFSGTANRNFLPSSIRNQIVANYNTCLAANPGNPGNCTTPSNTLNNPAPIPNPNPFQSLFQGPSAIFNEPDSIYNNGTIPEINLLRPFPQFDGAFSGLTLLTASAAYHSLQVRFQKRANHYVSFEGNYTLSKATDNSSAGANSFITTSLSSGNPQVLDNLRAEHSISANDATHRMVLATIVDVPVGRNRWIGRDMNRILDAVVGGWSISAILTFQTGTPINIGMASARLADGSQRPNILCSQPSSGLSYHAAAANGLLISAGQNIDPAKASVFNAACFGNPGDQVPGNAPRYFSNLRSDGIHNTDLSLSKEFTIREGMKLQVRGEFFNFTNTPRFGFGNSIPNPTTSFGGGQFGLVTRTLGSPRHTQIGVRFEF